MVSERRRWREQIRTLLLFLTPIVLILIAYFAAYGEARDGFLYTSQHALKLKPEAFSWQYLKQIPELLFIDLFFARFGWANVFISSLWARLSFGLWCTGALITGVETLKVASTQNEEISYRPVVLLFVVLAFACLGVLRYNLSVFQPQGRFLFPALTAWAILGFWGCSRLLRSRGRSIAVLILIGYMLAFNVMSLSMLFEAYYL